MKYKCISFDELEWNGGMAGHVNVWLIINEKVKHNCAKEEKLIQRKKENA